MLTAYSVLMKRFLGADTWQGVSMREYDVLYTLSKQDGPMRLLELNRSVLLSQPALSRMIDRLGGRGLIARTPDPADGRGVLLALTEEGRATQRRLGIRHAHSVAEAMTERLTPEELEALEAICRKLSGDP